jgi:S1-C subfamily serine protease
MAIFALLLSMTACKPGLMHKPDTLLTQKVASSVVRVTVTSQGYFFHRPWQQRQPVTRTAIGVIVEGGCVLVNALLVADHRYIEIESLDTQEKHRADVAVVDYEANLALIKPVDPGFLAHRQPLAVASKVGVGDELTIWQVKPNGDVVPGGGKVISTELTAFSQGHYFMVNRVDSTLQYRFNNLTLPVVKDDRLVGLVLRDSPQNRTIDVIATPVIDHFLKDARQDHYKGFPVAGFHYGDLADPQLRAYIGIPNTITGIYIQKVIKGGPADRAGLAAGDVITRIGDHVVTDSGQYDDPWYGKTSLVHLIRTGYQVGDIMPVTIFRKGELLTLPVKVDHRQPDEYLVPPYIVDQPPEYLIVGGLLMEELSLSYLREYGGDWISRAPIQLVYYNENQDYLNGDGRNKIVIIPGIIPTPFTMGYENLSNLVVQRVNGRKINRLSDVSEALKTPVNGFHKIEIEQHPNVLFLDVNEIPQIHKMIEERYRIPISPPSP